MYSHEGKRGAIFHYNTHLSGKVIVIYDGKEMEIPGEDILSFVAYAYVMRKRISKIEQMEVDELLLGN